jgi:hypothetical protein
VVGVIEVEFVVEEVGFLLEIHRMIAVVFDLDVEEVGSVVGEVEIILAEVGFVVEIHRMTFVVVEIEFVKHMTVVEMNIMNQMIYLEFERMMMIV